MKNLKIRYSIKDSGILLFQELDQAGDTYLEYVIVEQQTVLQNSQCTEDLVEVESNLDLGIYWVTLD